MGLTLGEIIKKYSLQYRQKIKLDKQDSVFKCPEKLKDDIVFVLQEIDYDNSIDSVYENLVYPVLKEAWKNYSNHLSLWGHLTLTEAEAFHADYLITPRSELGKIVMEPPFLVVIEVILDNLKRNRPILIEKLCRIQQLNEEYATPIHGILTNGEIWEFIKIEKNVLTHYVQRLEIGEIENLFVGLSGIIGFASRQASSKNKIFSIEVQSKSEALPSNIS